MSTTGTITHRLVVTGTNRTDVQVSKNPWNDSLIAAGGATGALLMRDTGKTDGWGWLDAVATGQVLCSGGVGTAPEWSASPAVTSVVIGGVTIDATDAGKIDGITNGTVTASKALVVDANKDLASLRHLTLSGNLNVSGGYITNNTGDVIDVNYGGDNSRVGLLKHLVFATDDTYDIGASGATRPRNLYLGTSLQVGTNPATVGAFRAAAGFQFQYRNNANSANLVALKSNVTSTDDLLLGNSSSILEIDSTRVTFGGQTSSFPAWKRVNHYFEARLADDSAFTKVVATDFVTGGTTGIFQFATWGSIAASADGKFVLRDNATTAFGMLQFGGATSSFPALKRNSAVLETKLADDSAYATHAAVAFQTMTALVALGGGAAPTLGTIGGSGPATAAQNTWLRMVDSTGAAFWVPVWK